MVPGHRVACGTSEKTNFKNILFNNINLLLRIPKADIALVAEIHYYPRLFRARFFQHRGNIRKKLLDITNLLDKLNIFLYSGFKWYKVA
jgi:hypothetical protein